MVLIHLVEKLQRGECESISFVVCNDSKDVMQGHISFTREELDGVPEDVVSGYAQRTEGDKVLYDVTFKTPDIWPLVSSICLSKTLTLSAKVEVRSCKQSRNAKGRTHRFRGPIGSQCRTIEHDTPSAQGDRRGLAV